MSARGYFDRQAEAIKAVIESNAKVGELNDQLTKALNCIENHLLGLDDQLKTKDIITILDRLRRIAELRNMTELGSFTIQITRAMDEAWRRLR